MIRAAIDSAMKDEEAIELDSNHLAADKRKKKKLVNHSISLNLVYRFSGKICLEMRNLKIVIAHRSLVWYWKIHIHRLVQTVHDDEIEVTAFHLNSEHDIQIFDSNK